ncbi:hypothetical protein TWF730_003226 [Orbilia blumenaviensis]|uniref:Methyltransferase n=1 Tax=Orbilia blumenaviensis TaxID=1796055 RepID=A0AAV9U5H6_9PEZI
MTEASNARFDSEAATWDLNPDIQSATNSAYAAILSRVPSLSLDNPNKPTLLDLGTGTGLLSLLLSPHSKSILSIDPSPAMIHALTTKLTSPTAPKNITPLNALITTPSDPRLNNQKFDIIVSNLVLHHIPNLTEFINLTYGLLNPGGVIMLTDFENTGEEARKFHPEDKMEGVERHGLVRDEMVEMVNNAGFRDGKVKVGWVMRKEVERFPGEWKGGKKPVEEEGREKCEMDFNFLVVSGTK